MKMVSLGCLKKIIDVDENNLKKSRLHLDPLHQVMRVRKPVRLKKTDLFQDPDLFMVTFQKIL